jgi:glycosyltransferase involved in cell wall biosynthesis
MVTKWTNHRLAVLCGPGVAYDGGHLYTLSCWGRMIEELATRFAAVHLCVPTLRKRTQGQDFQLPSTIKLFPLPEATTALQGFRHAHAFRTAFRDAIASADMILVRDALTPAVGELYGECYRQKKLLLHWLVTNPMGLLRSHRRDGMVKDNFGKLFVWWWERSLRRVHQRNALSGIISFGSEIAGRFPSPRNYVHIGSPIRSDEIQSGRTDTCCENERVRIMCMCFMRPEKGIQYLLEAFSILRTKRKTELVLVGARDRYPRYQRSLDAVCRRLNIEDRVKWFGHAVGTQMRELFHTADVFAFPSLSEGAPYVLVEARASGVPVVSTNVGGIPDSITHGYDGLLIPPKAPAAMAEAIDTIIEDGDLRRKLIANGLQRVKEFTVDKLVDKIMDVYARLDATTIVK